MERKKRFFMVWSPPPHLRVTDAGQADERLAIEFEMSATLAQALEGRRTAVRLTGRPDGSKMWTWSPRPSVKTMLPSGSVLR